MRPTLRTLLKLLPVVLIVVLFSRNASEQVQFEHFLNSTSIQFSDFDPNYAKALIAAQPENKVPEFTFPPLVHAAPQEQRQIPPTIHFIWFPNLYHDHLDVSKIPAIGSDAPALCTKYNPNFEIRTWNDTASRALLEEHYKWFIPVYDSYKHPIQRVDAVKYFILYHYGGIYMDLDIACRRPLDPLLPFPAWYPKASPFGVNNDLMATRARHPLMRLMIDRLEGRNKNLLFPYLTIFWSTGPQFTSDMLKEWWRGVVGGSIPATERVDGVFVLPQDFYSEKYTFFGHSPGGTWHGKDVAVVLWLVDRPWVFALAPVVLFVFFTLWLARRRRRAKAQGYKPVAAGE